MLQGSGPCIPAQTAERPEDNKGRIFRKRKKNIWKMKEDYLENEGDYFENEGDRLKIKTSRKRRKICLKINSYLKKTGCSSGKILQTM